MLNSDQSQYAVSENVLIISDIICSRASSARMRNASHINIIQYSNAITFYDDGIGLDITDINKKAIEQKIPDELIKEFQIYHETQFLNSRLKDISFLKTNVSTKIAGENKLSHFHFNFSQENANDGQMQVQFNVSIDDYNEGDFYLYEQGVVNTLFFSDGFFSNIEYISFKKVIISYLKHITRPYSSILLTFRKKDTFV